MPEEMRTDELILRFFKEDIGGILITGENGAVLYEDEKTAFIQREKTNWESACPAPAPGQKSERWDLVRSGSGKTYLVTTSTFTDGEGMKQIHQLTDTSDYTALYRHMSDYSRMLRNEKEYDSLTGLYNRSKFTEMKRSLFRNQDAIAVLNLDVNNLKQVNDSLGHEAGDRLIRKAAESLKRIEARNVIPFRIGGDEFVVAALHVNREEAEQIRQAWGKALEELNREEDGIPCTVACGFAFGEKGYDLETVLAEADRAMYENKRKMKETT